jgi:signal transduction histidine kinase
MALLLLAVIGATLFFWVVIHQVSGLWLDVALRPEVREALQRSMDDQKNLRALDTSHRDDYRRRFETTRKLLQRLDVIRMNREEMLRRFEVILVGLFALAAAAAAISLRQRYRRAQTLERRQYLDRVSVLQENARRHAHEMKGPLTAARLELERALEGDQEALASVAEELERLTRLSRQQASFAAIGKPVLRRDSLRAVVEEFCATFGNAWPGVSLRFGGGDAEVCADRDMVRQVLVNLCSNSALAIEGEGSVTFTIARRTLDVIDTGGGIPESLRASVFDPYVTTRRTGEGMGLGLSISRKIMIDHGGDLQLAATSTSGTTFRLIFGETECS